MTFATQSRHALRYVTEESYGVRPDPMTVTEFRHSGCDLSLNRQSIESDEIRSDRMISHFFQGTEEVAGEIEFEWAYGDLDMVLAGAVMQGWSGNRLQSGTELISFSLERYFSDIGDYQQFSGCVVDRLDLSIQPDSLVSGTAHIRGKALALGETPFSETVTAPGGAAPMEAFKGVLEEGGNPVGYVAGLDLKIENGLEPVYALGSRSAVTALYGKSRISGEVTTYFEDQALFEKFCAQTHSSLKLTLSGDGGSYEILLPKILYMSAENPVRGDRAVTASFGFVALADDVTGTDIRIDRIAA